MSAKFHVSADGTPHQCFASIRPCPLGGADKHYTSESEAREAFEASMAGETFAPLSKGYTVTTLVQVGEGTMPGSSGTYKRLPLKGGFASPKEAVAWAKENVRDATQLVNLDNEDYTPTTRMDEQGRVMARSGDPMETGDFKSLNLIDISEERDVLESKEVPTIGKFWIKRYGSIITDEATLKRHTARIASHVDQRTLQRVRAYVRAGTFGPKKTER